MSVGTRESKEERVLHVSLVRTVSVAKSGLQQKESAVRRSARQESTSRKTKHRVESARAPSAHVHGEVSKDQLVQSGGDAKNSSGEENGRSAAKEIYSIGDSREALLESDGYVHPEYPRKSRSLNQEGTVQVRVELQEGVLREQRVLVSTGFPLLDEAALEAIRRWKFRPLSLAYVQSVTFKLK